MHKYSWIIFGLLLGSLVMLTPLAIPFFNTNSFSEAMAQGYNPYNEYPTKDYKYECRTGPFEGFFVSSVEFCLVDKENKDRPIVEPPKPPTPPNKPPCNVTVDTITGVGERPEGIAYDPINERMYVTNTLFQGTVSVIDTTTNTVIDTIPVGIDDGTQDDP